MLPVRGTLLLGDPRKSRRLIRIRQRRRGQRAAVRRKRDSPGKRTVDIDTTEQLSRSAVPEANHFPAGRGDGLAVGGDCQTKCHGIEICKPVRLLASACIPEPNVVGQWPAVSPQVARSEQVSFTCKSQPM